VKAAARASAKPPRGNAIDAWHAWCKSQIETGTIALCGQNRCGLHNESSASDQFHVRRDRMFHYPRRLRSTFACALALSAILALPALAAGTKTITAVMHSDLRALDPIITTAYIQRDYGYMVYDTLLATDSSFKIQPQMADWKVSDDKLTYTFTLRDGLKWHDGAPVTAEDCVASLQRWGKRDGMGQKLMSFTASLEATDAKTITLKLKEPYGLVLETIGKPSSVVPFMMPKRVAETPADKQITEQIGSGPFKFVAAEFQPGVKAVFEKNKDYVPRKEPPSWTSGGKVVKVDRVEWITMADAQTAVNALQSGDIDFMENPSWDILPVLAANKDLTVKALDELGFQTVGRMNFLYPPFDNLKVRRAAFMAMNQKDVLDALVGNPQYYKLCGAIFMCDTPLATDVGSESLLKKNGMAEAKKLLAESGYDGTPVVIMAPGDVVTLKAQPIVAAQLLRDAGFKVDVQATDWQTIVSRRASQKPPKEGGWNMFFTNWAAADVVNPIASLPVSGKGKNGAWFGWPEDARLEELRDAYARSSSPDEQKKIAAELQARVYEQVIYIPLGQYVAPGAWRKSLTGVLGGPATPVFWNIDKSE
jgi:peptide/nickel transport system substrate-binding protein